MSLMLFLVLALNFGISWFNAWSVGKAWPETKAVGGWPRFMVWMGAVMSACGFTWVYLIVLGMIVSAVGWLPPDYLRVAMSLGYLVLILPILGSGLAITVNSWVYFWRQKTFGGGIVAGWNTFAQIHNTYRAISAIPSALKDVSRVFSRNSDNDSAKAKLVIIAALLVVAAVAGGILTTTAIVRVTARGHVGKLAEAYQPA